MIFVALATLSAAAQDNGTWKVHPIFTAAPQNVVDAGDVVYYLASNNLFRFNKQSKTTEVMTKDTGLSDVNVTQIYYNKAKSLLFVVYESSNIDLIASNGRITNIPAIKDAVMPTEKTINYVSFTGSEAYVATAFGYAVLNLDNMQFTESKNFNQNILSAAKVGDYVVISTADILLMANASAPHETIAQFTETDSPAGTITPINDSKFFLNTSSQFYVVTIFGGELSAESIVAATAGNVQQMATGFIASFYTAKYYIKFDDEGVQTAKTSGNAELFSSIESDGSLWGVSTNGLRHVGVTSYYKPNSLNIAIPWDMLYNATQNKLYVASKGRRAVLTSGSQTNIQINSLNLSTGTWTVETPVLNSVGGAECFLAHPTEPNLYFMGTWLQGTYKVNTAATRWVTMDHYYWTNSPMTKALNFYCHNVNAFDKAGNLWIVQTDNTAYAYVLPSDKVLSTTAVTESDWLSVAIPSLESNMRARFVITPNTDIKVFVNGDYHKPFFVWDDGGNPSGNITSRTFTSFHDQDNKAIEWSWIYDMKADLTDNVWVGYADGVFAFNPSNAFSDDFRVTRIKTADGTNLLEGEQVNTIGVDSQNRKWIGTNSQGLFLVSPDGSQIIKHFDTSNSALTSNKIYCVYCNPATNSVYMSTTSGFLEYIDGETSEITDYSATYAYPNPVPHNFTGYVTVESLVSDSYVNIINEAGTLIASTQATGTRAIWDVCDANGARVPTGTYYVCASASDQDTRTVVAKILVIK